MATVILGSNNLSLLCVCHFLFTILPGKIYHKCVRSFLDIDFPLNNGVPIGLQPSFFFSRGCNIFVRTYHLSYFSCLYGLASLLNDCHASPDLVCSV